MEAILLQDVFLVVDIVGLVWVIHKDLYVLILLVIGEAILWLTVASAQVHIYCIAMPNAPLIILVVKLDQFVHQETKQLGGHGIAKDIMEEMIIVLNLFQSMVFVKHFQAVQILCLLQYA